jgi:hypothetical protein
MKFRLLSLVGKRGARPPIMKSIPASVLPVSNVPTSAHDENLERAMQASVARQRESDPYLGAKFAGREIFMRVSEALEEIDDRLRAQSLLCALGAVAGHACQASVCAQSLLAGNAPDEAFQVLPGSDGKNYFAGEALDGPLAANKMSVWSLATGAAQHHGADSLPDLEEIFRHNVSVVGSAQFGVPRLPPEHPVHATPIEFATRLWPLVHAPVSKLTGNPKLWPIAAGIAIQEAIALTKDVVPPEVAVRIVMECAIPVSKIPIEV